MWTLARVFVGKVSLVIGWGISQRTVIGRSGESLGFRSDTEAASKGSECVHKRRKEKYRCLDKAIQRLYAHIKVAHVLQSREFCSLAGCDASSQAGKNLIRLRLRHGWMPRAVARSLFGGKEAAVCDDNGHGGLAVLGRNCFGVLDQLQDFLAVYDFAELNVFAWRNDASNVSAARQKLHEASALEQYRPFNCGHSPKVKKNWLVLLFFPLFALTNTHPPLVVRTRAFAQLFENGTAIQTYTSSTHHAEQAALRKLHF